VLLSAPEGVAVDSAGNLYVADTGNDVIRKITPAGSGSTLAGRVGKSGAADGTGAAALFFQPAAVALDKAGNLYVADSDNDTIRMVTPGGLVTTLGGMPGNAGSVDGTGSSARFNYPLGAAVDGEDNLYVTDSENDTIRRGLRIVATELPTIATQPQDQTIASGSIATLSVVATANSTYQWTFDGVAISGATASSYSISNAQLLNSGVYEVTVTNAAGSVTSNSAFLTVTIPAGTLSLDLQPSSFTTVPGSTFVLSVSATGTVSSGAKIRATSGSSGVTYQWYVNGVALVDGDGISGSQTATLVISGGATQSGSYTCLVQNSTSSILSDSATVNVAATADPGRLINLSCRAQVGAGASTLITGFSVGGSGTSGQEPLLIRASGPALTPFGVTGVLADPSLKLYSTMSGSNLLATNTGWEGDPEISNSSISVGAFPWSDSASHDAAFVELLASGPYTANISGESGDSGVALAEIYDATPQASYTADSPRLINLSARSQVGEGDNVLIAGFVIGGSSARTMLIRGSGPALAAFGVSGMLPDPLLQVYRSNADGSSSEVQYNSGWLGNPQIASIASSVGAFSWGTSATLDSAVLVTLGPGAYTVEISGASGDTGIALIEVYEVP